MKAIRIHRRGGGLDGLVLEDVPYPHAAENDVIVKVHAAGFTPGELDWPGTWTDRAGRDRTPSVPGHEVAGEVVELGLGTAGLAVGQRVFGLTDWTRDGTLAEYVAVEARNLAPLPASIGYAAGAALPLAGLTAWQALFDHGRLAAGQTALVHGAAGGVGSYAVQLARRAGAYVIGTGRERDRAAVLEELGADEFAALDEDGTWAEAVRGRADVLLDVIGGGVLERSGAAVRPGGTLVTIAAPPPQAARPEDGRAVFFIVEPDRVRLAALARLVQDGELRPQVGGTYPLAATREAFAAKAGTRGKVVIQPGS